MIAAMLALPALFSGWLGDDYIHYALLHPDIHIPRANDWSFFGLFSWVDAEPDRTVVLMDRGVIPWWTYEGFRYQFWRPLAELSHWLDHAVWRDSPVLMHVHSLLWYLALGYLLFRLYGKSGMSAFAAISAMALFVWDSSHGLTVAWIANRNALMAAVFGVMALLLHMRWREGGERKVLLLSLLSLLCSLFSGEIGISTAGYLGAFALTMDRAGPRRALLALWPYVLVCVVWWLAYKAGHFGANNSETNYIDPLESPFIFVSKLLERIPILLAAQFGIVPADVAAFFGGGVTWFALVSLLFMVVVVWVMTPILKASPLARFWALGCLFAAAPISASIPADRNLMMVGIGASALLGMLFDAVVSKALTNRFIRGGAYVLFAIHLVISPLMMPLFSYSPKVWNLLMALPVNQRMPIESAQDRVLLFGLSMPISLATMPMRFAHKLTVPERLWLISSDAMTFRLERTSPSTVRVVAEKGMINEFEQTLRTLGREPLQVGQVITTDGMALRVETLNDDGRPQELSITLDERYLEHAVIIHWTGKAFERLPLPAVGVERLLAPEV